eukprot:266627_1
METYIFSIFLLQIILTFGDWDCQKTVNGTVSSNIPVTGNYDLCDFVVGSNSQDGWYAAYDNRSVGNAEIHGGDAVNYTFYFNIAANIAKPTPDPECDNYNKSFRQIHGLEIGYCRDIRSAGMQNSTCADNTDNIIPITTMAAAYQAKKGKTDTDKCWRLHDGTTEPIWTFLNKDDPALGIELTYINGDWCQAFGKNREFKLQFKCANDVKITPDYITTVFETIGSGCSYEFEMSTFRGCPTECIVDNDQLCSDHGVCDYDWSKGAPKCFCYNGWYGNDCSDDQDPNREIIYQDSDNSYVGALVVVILLLLVILFILGYLFLRYTRIKHQPFDFKFLQQTKKKRGKKSGNDEYETE